MPVTQAHGLFATQVGSVVIGGIGRNNLVTGTTVRSETTSGEVFPAFQSIVSQRPTASFQTMQLKRALDLIGLLGKDIAALPSPLNFFGHLALDGSTRASGAAHRKYSINNGILIPQTLSVDHQGDATLTYQAIVTYDGTNDPIVISDLQTLPAGIADDERYSIGKMVYAGLTLTHVRSWELDFGIDAQSEGTDSEVWDRFSYIRTVQPVITMRGIGLEWMKAANIPLLGKTATHADTTLYLRKYKDGSTFELDASAVHIKITAAGFVHVDTPMDASGNDPAEITLMMTCKFDGINDPVKFDTASTIV